MTPLKHLGRVLTAYDNDWPVVVTNMRKARRKWGRFSRILGWEGANAWTPGTFYKAVVQAALLFGSETWVVNLNIGEILGGFHHRLDLCLSGMKPWCGTTRR